ncbi:AF4/FMR2 family member 4-like isoform X2 [Actinia tenebrosa]|nr:AF4/FMR2 family member 4-like isoform X2 [Actinia tenebrosa]
MTQSQASPYMSSSYLYGVSSKGLHGISIHEREREAEKERRAQQLRNVESNSHPAHLFSQPIKIPPSKEDTLQHSIQAALGDFEVLAPSLNQKQQYSLLGIIPKVPQTPVESGNKVFSFDNANSTSNKKEHGNENTSSKSQKTLSTVHHHKTKPNSLEEKPKSVESDSKPSTKSSGASKKMGTMETENKGSHAVKALFMDEAKPKSSSSVKKEIKPISNEINKSEHQKRLDDRGDAKMHKSTKKESKDFTSKPKPPKLSINARTSAETTTEGANLSGDTNRVEKILEEMTQPVAPPITAIHTPLKSNEKFAFPLAASSLLPHDSNNSTGHHNGHKHEEELTSLLEDDLEMSDDEDHGSSSEDSDSDSSDSDSDSSDSDNSPPNSPVRSKSSELNKPSKGGLNHPEKSHTKKILPTTTASASTTTSLTLNSTIGGDGLRGDQVAPAANSSPLNSNSLNTKAVSVLDKEITDSLFDDDMHCFDPLPELPDLSKDLLGTVFGINGTNTSCLDDILSNGLNNSQSLEPEKSDKYLISHLPQDKDNLPKVKDNKLNDKELNKTSNSSKKLEKKIKHGGDSGSKAVKEKPEKEKQDKAVKQNVKSKKISDAVKLKSKDNISNSNKSLVNSNKIDSKTIKTDKSLGEKKSSKVKKNSSKPTLNGSTETPTKSSDGENEEIDVVTVSNDKPFTNRTESSISQSKTSDNPKNNNSSKSSNPNIVKNKTSLEKTLNGRKEPSNGKMSPNNMSPKNGLSIDEITLDCNSKPGELVVKIPLALLRRIPHLNGSDTFAIKLGNTEMLNEEHQNGLSPARKAVKHHLSVECSESKKIKAEPELNGVIKKSKSNDTKNASSRNESERHEGRRNSTSSTSSLDREQSRRKRSPSRDGDWNNGKRRRHDSEGQRSEREKLRERSKDRDFEKSCNKMNGWDGTKIKSPVEHSETCLCGGQENDNIQKDSWISKLYEPEPKVLRGPDYYLHEAKRVKHHADAIKENIPRAHKYFEAVLSFVYCGKALEQNNESESQSAYQMYVETIEMLKYAMRLSATRSHTEKNGDKRFFGLCLRLQALLYMRLFKLRKDSMLKASKSLLEHFKGQVKMSQAPSPYNVSNPKTGTPSPMSPTPSPSGSIGSVGSVGSASSNEAMTTPSRTNKVSCMTSPVNATIPQKVQTMTYQHLGFTNHMLYGYDAWEQSQQIFVDHKEFFMDLDRKYGPVTLHSPIVDVVEYVRQGYQRLMET